MHACVKADVPDARVATLSEHVLDKCNDDPTFKGKRSTNKNVLFPDSKFTIMVSRGSPSRLTGGGLTK